MSYPSEPSQLLYTTIHHFFCSCGVFVGVAAAAAVAAQTEIPSYQFGMLLLLVASRFPSISHHYHFMNIPWQIWNFAHTQSLSLSRSI